MSPQKSEDHHHCRKSATVKFLITLLILPSFPEQAVCYQTRYYSSSSPVDGTKADIMRGYSRRTAYPAVTPTFKFSLPKQRPYNPSSVNSSNLHHHHQQGMIILQQTGSLPPQPQPYVMEQVPQIIHMHRTGPAKAKWRPTEHPVAVKNSCPGHKNIIDDIGILSLITAVMSTSFGLYTILVNSMTSNNIGIVSGFMSLLLWVPSTIITLFNLSGDHVYLLGNLLNQMSFINSMYGFMGVVFGTADVLASAAGESVGIFSFILSVIATFPEFLDAIIKYMYRFGGSRTLEYYVENYGCSVPRIFNFFGKPLYNVVNDFLVRSVGQQKIY